MSYVAHRELGNVEKASFHKYVFDGLVWSITSSGDGKSPKTAYVVISVDEEYALMHFLSLRRVGQALVREEGHSYDKMTGVDRRTNATVTLYFNIDKPLSWLGRRIQEQRPKE